jgi:hypothetical protein
LIRTRAADRHNGSEMQTVGDTDDKLVARR